MNKALKVNCPTCKKEVVWEQASSYRPFCSDRCQQIDLGAWADEAYAIPAEPSEQWSGAEGFDSHTSDTESLSFKHTIQ